MQSQQYLFHDNPGAGNCGYYALAMGIIHLATQTKNFQSIDLWKEKDKSIEKDLERALQIDILNYREHRALLFRLQKSLRKILVDYFQVLNTEDPTQCNYYSDFLGLFKDNIDFDSRHSFLRNSKQLKPLIDEIRKKLKIIAQHYDPKLNPSVYTLAKNNLLEKSFCENKQLILDVISVYYLSQPSWATSYDLYDLSVKCFQVQLQVFVNGQFPPTDDPNDYCIRLNNQMNVHWTLYTWNPLVAQSTASPVEISFREEFLSLQKVLKRNDRKILNTFLEHFPNQSTMMNRLIDIADINEEDSKRYFEIFNNIKEWHTYKERLEKYKQSLQGAVKYHDYDLQKHQYNLDKYRIKCSIELTEEDRKQQLQALDQSFQEINEALHIELETFSNSKLHIDESIPQYYEKGFFSPKPNVAYTVYGGLAGLVIGLVIAESIPTIIGSIAALLAISQVGAFLLFLAATIILTATLTSLAVHTTDYLKNQPSF